MADTGTICWVLSDGRKGMENQCLGLAERVADETGNLTIITKRIQPHRPWKWLPESILGRPWPFPFAALGQDGDTLVEPWPHLLIACGRKTVAYSAAIKRRSHGRTFVVQLQDPRLNSRYFDLVIPPKHDHLTGDNVLPILGSPNRITPGKLADGIKQAEGLFGALPRPLVAVLIGGSSRHFTLDLEVMDDLVARLARLANEGYGLMITTSRRTGTAQEDLLRSKLQGPNVYIWNGVEPNPYFAMLGLADHIMVTEESTNMVTEAAATGKPVHVIALKGRSRKFARFHAEMKSAGITRTFDDALDSWHYEPLNETGRAAKVVAGHLGPNSIIHTDS